MARFLGALSLAVIVSIVAVLALIAVPTNATAQSAFGIPPFSTVGGGPDAINLSNLSFVYTVPVFGRAGRGSTLSIVRHLQNDLWSPGYNSNGVLQWLLSFPPPSNGVGFVFYSGPVHKTCNDGGTVDYYVYTFSGYYDSAGTSHPFNLAVSDLDDGGGTCVNVNKQYPGIKSGVSSDGSGVSMTVTDFPLTAVVTLRDGTVIHAPLATYNGYYTSGTAGPFTAIDSNGNEITANGTGLSITNIVDTLGTSAATFGSNTVSYTAPSGASATFTVSTTRYTVQTAFGCPGVAEFPAAQFDTWTGVTLPDGSSYQITYEPTSPGSQNITGRIASVRLPTGATISYTYTGGDTGKGIVCADGSTAGFNRTTPDGTWHYLRSNVVGQCCTGVTSSTTTITDPQGNTTVINFGGNFETQRQVYTGAATGTPIETVITCYNGNTTNCGSAAGGGTAAPKEVNTFRSFNGGPQSEVDTFYNGFGLVTAANEYDFGVTTPTRKTTITYDTTLGNGIVDRPSQVTVTDGNSNLQSQTNYTYDEDQAALQTSGASQLVSVICGTGFTKCRGNATTIKRYVTATSTLNSTFTHYDTGQVYQATDVNGAVSTNTYGACGHSFLTNVSLPLSLSKSFGWNCTGGVMTSSTDENGQISYTNYTTDSHFWRPESTKDQLGNINSLTYASLVRSEASLPVTSSAYVDVTKTLDSLGRPSLTQVRKAPGSSNFDTVYQTYDSDGRPFHAFMPCVASLGVGCSTASTTSYYNGMGRMTQSKDGSNAVVQNLTYNLNDSYIDVVAPTGENDKRKQLEYDGLGRLTSVCEILSSGGTSCGQNTAASGYKTAYSYSVLASGGSQMVATQGSQTRTYIYDALGRLTSETNPESGTTTYTYDTDSTCGTSNGDLVKKLDNANVTTCYHYDILHRLTGKANSLTATNVCLVYDTPQGAIPSGVSISNGAGRLVEAYTDHEFSWSTCNDKTGLLTDEYFSYSARGENTDVYESTPNSGGYYHTTAGYYANGALSSLSGVPTLNAWSFAVDGEGRPYSATYGTTNWVKSTTYYPSNPQTTVTYGIGTTPDSDVYSYDANTGRMSQFKFIVGATPQSLTGTLGWNTNGTLGSLGITDQLNSSNTQNCSYVHDDLARVKSVNCLNGSTAVWSQNFTLDQFGNISKSGTSTFAASYLANGTTNNQEQSVGSCVPSYDAIGNLTRDCSFIPAATNTWDAYGNPSSLNGVNLTYDALGREVEIASGSSHSQILYSPIGKLGVMNGQTPVVTRYPLPGGSTAQITGTNTAEYTLHSDWLGSSRLATNLNTRTMAYDVAYAPYGENYGGSGTLSGALDFTGDFQDTLSGLYDFLYRKQSPLQGRWLSPDPAGLGAVDMTNPQSWNRYAYVENSPLNAVDPLGLHDPNELASYDHFLGDLQALLDPGGAWLSAQNQQFLIQSGQDSNVQQGLRNYQAEVDDAFNGTSYTQAPGYFTSTHFYVPGATVSYLAVDYESGGSFIGYDWGSWDYSSLSITGSEMLSEAEEINQSWAMTRMGMSREDYNLWRVANRVTFMSGHLITACEAAVDGPAIVGGIAGFWTEGVMAKLIWGAGVTATLASWSVCK